MPGEGYRVTMALIGGFILTALFGMIMISMEKASPETILGFYVGLGTLAKLFGLPEAIQAWLSTRGQTSQPPQP